MNNFIIGSFYTEHTPYEEVAHNYLLKSCIDILNKSPIILTSKNYGNWYRNVAEKPKIILDLFNILKDNVCLVFLDADATIEQYPKLFEEIPEEYDIAFHYLDWATWYGYKDSKVKELLTGTMFFRNNDKTRELCLEWHCESVKTTEWEQKVLQRILSKYDLKIYELPIEYCYIKTLPNGNEPLVKINNPVIIHHQLSRELKKRLK